MTTLNIQEMKCNHCVQRINSLLDELNIKHSTSLDHKTVTIEGTKEDVNKAIEELDDIGFTATIA
ncbi:MAG: heavy-metal-associated domain-containing protein [Clostridiales bacterium]|nr:heavy-metal-associated domain-containing protein [Clostridiales bacterium]